MGQARRGPRRFEKWLDDHLKVPRWYPPTRSQTRTLFLPQPGYPPSARYTHAFMWHDFDSAASISENNPTGSSLLESPVPSYHTCASPESPNSAISSGFGTPPIPIWATSNPPDINSSMERSNTNNHRSLPEKGNGNDAELIQLLRLKKEEVICRISGLLSIQHRS